jgi:hypothetical protein
MFLCADDQRLLSNVQWLVMRTNMYSVPGCSWSRHSNRSSTFCSRSVMPGSITWHGIGTYNIQSITRGRSSASRCANSMPVVEDVAPKGSCHGRAQHLPLCYLQKTCHTFQWDPYMLELDSISSLDASFVTHEH